MRKWRCMWRPYLKEEHALKRLQWAHCYRHFTTTDWARAFWSDECIVERGIGMCREWTFVRPKDQPKSGQVQGILSTLVISVLARTSHGLSRVQMVD